MFSIVKAGAAPELFDAWRADPGFASAEAHPLYGAFGRRYYPATFGDAFRDESFAVCYDARPVLLAPCTACERQISYFELPVQLFARADIEAKTARAAVETAFEYFDALQMNYEVSRVIIADDSSLGTLSPTGKQCLNRGYRADVRLTGIANFDEGEPGLRRNLRKSYHSLVNWGRRNLEIAIVDEHNPDGELFRRYQNFHREVAGRTTRPQQSWDVMFDWIVTGYGDLVLGLIDGKLVSGTMVVDGTTTSYYASGVYDRNRFDKPLGHFPLWRSIVRSAERGMRHFDLGDLPLAGASDVKDVAIGYFKRGFATTIATSIAWTKEINLQPETSAR